MPVIREDGWFEPARRCVSPNFGPRPQGVGVDLVVVHSISLPPGAYGGDAIERLFMNRLEWSEHPEFEKIRGLQVSSHFLVRRDGELLQFVSCDDRAWHAGASSWKGRADCNNYSVGVELEGLEGTPFEPAQYHTLGVVIDALCRRYAIGEVVGHEHVAPGRKADPGAAFDWAGLSHRLRHRALAFPPSGSGAG
jgi:AmpD protein